MDHFYSFQSFFARFDSQILSRAVELIKTPKWFSGSAIKVYSMFMHDTTQPGHMLKTLLMSVTKQIKKIIFHFNWSPKSTKGVSVFISTLRAEKQIDLVGSAYRWSLNYSQRPHSPIHHAVSCCKVKGDEVSLALFSSLLPQPRRGPLQANLQAQTSRQSQARSGARTNSRKRSAPKRSSPKKPPEKKKRAEKTFIFVSEVSSAKRRSEKSFMNFS